MALGLGVAVASGQSVANAEPGEATDASTTSTRTGASGSKQDAASRSSKADRSAAHTDPRSEDVSDSGTTESDADDAPKTSDAGAGTDSGDEDAQETPQPLDPPDESDSATATSTSARTDAKSRGSHKKPSHVVSTPEDASTPADVDPVADAVDDGDGREPSAAESVVSPRLLPASDAETTAAPLPASSQLVPAPPTEVTATIAGPAGANPFAADDPLAPAGSLAQALELAYASRRSNRFALINGAPTATSEPSGQSGEGVVTGAVVAVDPEDDPLSYRLAKAPAKGVVELLSDGTYRYTPGTALRQTGGDDHFDVIVDDNVASLIHYGDRGLSLFGTGRTLERITVSVSAVNSAPTAIAVPTVGIPNSVTGEVSGRLNVVDPDADPLRYALSKSPAKGQVSVDVLGTFTYEPSLAARLRVASVTATAADRQDSFEITVSDGKSTTTVAVSVPVTAPHNVVIASLQATGKFPAGVAVSSDGARVYVSHSDNGSVSVIDTVTNAITDTIDVGGKPQAVAVSPDGAHLYVANIVNDVVTVIDTGTRTVIGQVAVGDTPTALAVSGDGSKVYVTNLYGESLSVIDTASSTVAAVDVGVGPTAVVVGADGRNVYVANTGDNTVTVIDATSNTVLATVDVGAGPQALAAYDDRIYVANFGDDSVSVIDVASNEVTKTIDVGARPGALAVTPDGTELYVANYADGTVSVVDTETFVAGAPIAVGPNPTALAVNPAGTRAFVAGVGGAVSVISIDPALGATPPLGSTRGFTVFNQTSHTLELVRYDERGDLENGGPSVGTKIPPNGSLRMELVWKFFGNNTTKPVFAALDNGAIYSVEFLVGPILAVEWSRCTVSGPGQCGPKDLTSDLDRVVLQDAAETVTPVRGKWFNTLPTANPAQLGQTSTGEVSGTVGAIDRGGDPLSYQVSRTPNNGVATVDSTGKWTYVPREGFTGTDSFAVTVDDNVRSLLRFGGGFPLSFFNGTGKIVKNITVQVKPNAAPTAPAAPTVGVPDAATGAVRGRLNVVDPDGHPLTYIVQTAPGKGQVGVDGTGVYTYVPAPVARLLAASPNAADPDKQDSFTIAVSDGAATKEVTVTVPVSPQADAVLATIDVPGDFPVAVALSPDGTRAYVTGTEVTVVDTATDDVLGTIPVKAFAYGVALSRNGSRAYVTDSSAGEVSVIDTFDNHVVSTIKVGNDPRAVALSADDRWAYVANSADGTVSVIDTASTLVTAVIPVGNRPTALALTPDGQRLFVANAASGTVTTIDTSNNLVDETIGVGQDLDRSSPEGVIFSPDGARAYVTDSASNRIAVIDTENDTVVDFIDLNLGSQPTGVAISADGKQLYVTEFGAGTVTVIDTAGKKVITQIGVGGSPNAVVVSADGTRAFVANAGADSINVLAINPDLRAGEADTTLLGSTRGILVYNLSPDPLTLTAYLGNGVLENGGPAIGTVIPSGGVIDFEVVWYFFSENKVTPVFTAPNGAKYVVDLVVRAVFGDTMAGCTASGGVQCSPTTLQLGATSVKLLGVPGTVIDIPPSQSTAQAAVLDKLCYDGSPAVCKFKATSQGTAFTEPKFVGFVENGTSVSQPLKTTTTDTVTQKDSISVTGKASFKVLEIVNIEISATYGHEWTGTHTFTEELTLNTPPHKRIDVYAAEPLFRVTGDFTLTMGNTTWILRGVVFDTPDPKGRRSYSFRESDYPPAL